jgi:hypothetical protein
MNPAQFKAKWAKYAGKESAAYQDHFSDICRMLNLPTPVEADPTGEADFCFQKRVVKDAELFVAGEPDAEYAAAEHGFADVWKRDCSAWEYKGKKNDLSDEQILERLLGLNLERTDAERKAGTVGKRTSRAKREDEMI